MQDFCRKNPPPLLQGQRNEALFFFQIVAHKVGRPAFGVVHRLVLDAFVDKAQLFQLFSICIYLIDIFDLIWVTQQYPAIRQHRKFIPYRKVFQLCLLSVFCSQLFRNLVERI